MRNSSPNAKEIESSERFLDGQPFGSRGGVQIVIGGNQHERRVLGLVSDFVFGFFVEFEGRSCSTRRMPRQPRIEFEGAIYHVMAF